MSYKLSKYFGFFVLTFVIFLTGSSDVQAVQSLSYDGISFSLSSPEEVPSHARFVDPELHTISIIGVPHSDYELALDVGNRASQSDSVMAIRNGAAYSDISRYAMRKASNTELRVDSFTTRAPLDPGDNQVHVWAKNPSGLFGRFTYHYVGSFDIERTSYISEEEDDNLEQERHIGELVLPDLVIESIEFNHEEDKVEYIVRNRGNVEVVGNISLERVGLNEHGEEVRPRRLAFPNVLSEGLAPGEMYTIVENELIRSLGEAHSLQAIIDSADEVNESDEENNSLAVDIPRPDLIVESIELDIENDVVGYVITNQGAVAATGNISLERAALNERGEDIDRGRIVLPNVLGDGLSAGETRTLRERNFTNRIRSSASSLSATIDYNDVVSESNEENNIFVLDILLPDFVLVDARVDSDNPGDITVWIKNEGSIASSIPSIEISWLDVNGNLISSQVEFPRQREIDVGQTRRVAIRANVPDETVFVRLFINPNRSIREVNTNNNEWSGLPDFIVTQANFEDNGQIESLSLKNEGNVSVSHDLNFNIIWLDSDRQRISGQRVVYPADHVRRVTPGRRRARRVPVNIIRPPNSTYARIVIDPQYTVMDSNRGNNDITVLLPTYIDPRPDLTVRSITFDGMGQPEVVVQNQGGGAADSQMAIGATWAWLNNDGEPLDAGSLEIPHLRPRENYEFGANNFSNQPQEAFQFRFFVDAFRVVDEYDEQNNEKIEDLFMPDLIVEDVIFDSETRRPVITIKNQGAARANTPDHHLLYSYFGEGEELTRPPGVVDTGALNLEPGESFVFENLPSMQPSTQRANFIIDLDNILNESNEANNRYTANIALIPDLSVSWVNYDPENRNIRVRLENIGYASLNPEVFSFTIFFMNEETSVLGRYVQFVLPNNRLDPGENFDFEGIVPEQFTSQDASILRVNVRALDSRDQEIFEANRLNNRWIGPIINDEIEEEEMVWEDENEGENENKDGGDLEDDKEIQDDDASDEEERGLFGRILPGNPLYFIKSGIRELKVRITRDKVRRIELRQEIVKEKSREIKTLLKKGKTKQAVKHLERFDKELEKVEKETENLVGVDINKITEINKEILGDQLKQQKTFFTLERVASDKELKKVKEAKEKTTEKIGKTIVRINNEKEVQKIINKTLNSKGSPFKELKNVEVLKFVSEKVPDQAKQAIQKVIEKKTQEFADQYKFLPVKQKKLLPVYIKKTSGDEKKLAEIIKQVGEKVENLEIEKEFEFAKDILEKPILEEEIEKDEDQKDEEKDTDADEDEDEDQEKDGELDEEKDVQETEEQEVEEVCLQEHKPVCGINKKTYSNTCFAKKAGVPVDYIGQCKQECSSTKELVCGVDGKTYTNKCFAEEKGVRVDYAGECKVPCSTQRIPVCGINGTTYTNKCLAEEAGIRVDYIGDCKVPCSKDYVPVCGKDGLTYTNKCFAEEKGAQVDYIGECEISCSSNYIPVCGTNGQTYTNKCLAEEAGIQVDYSGECNVPQADLSVSDLSFSPSSLTEGDYVSFSAVIKNYGDKAASNFSTKLSINGSGVNTKQISSLESSGSYNLSWKGVWKSVAGTHTYQICVDTETQIDESNENNNCTSGTFSVDEVSPPPQLPDLKVSSFTLDPSYPVTSDYVSFFGVIKNSGAGDSSSAIVRLRIDEDTDGKWETTKESKTNTVKSGGSESLVWNKIWKAPTGKHTFELCVDPSNSISEDSDSNNCWTETVSVK